MDLFALMQKKLNQPVDIFETMQRSTIEVLGKLAFGHKFGVSTRNLFILLIFIINIHLI